ncbi:MAG: type I-U CRISPR-associated helicase/endonuclease Cas3, partial [bacterium]
MAVVQKRSEPPETVFEGSFKSLTGHAPFPWQSQLFEQFSEGVIPQSCSLPTGLGKTNVIAVWLIALVEGIRLPRRLVYVVNRRTVVDQTTTEVERLRMNLPKLGADGFRTLSISTLRGQFADNREWSADPSMPAVICGTVDMIGSRLLFSGYRAGFRSRPLHAAFLGQDALLVHDEAHLEPAFQKLIEAVQQEQATGERSTALPWPKLRVMALSATLRGEESSDDGRLTLQPADHHNPVIKRRVQATKQLHLHPCEDENKALVERMAEQALRHKESGDTVLVFVRRVADVDKLVKKLTARQIGVPSDQVATLTGTMRGFERDQLVRTPAFVRFLPAGDRPADSGPAEGTVFLICTSAGEVGVNLSADHIICDLSTFESMVQRLGRVNRFGAREDTRVDVVYPEKFSDKDKLAPARKATLDLLKELNGDASPWALDQLDAAACQVAFAPEPSISPTSDILFDAWSLTTIRQHLPGRPPVELYLHGVAEWQPPETHVAWREEVDVVTRDLLRRYYPEDLLDEYPLKPRELLRDRTDRVFKALQGLADRCPEKPVWIRAADAVVEVTSLRQLASGHDNRIADCTVLLPPSAGGLLHGMLAPESEQAEDVADAPIVDDVPADVELRVRVYSDDPSYETKTAGMRRILSVEVDDAEGGDEPLRWDWFERVPREGGRTANRAVDFDTHIGDVEQRARDIVGRLQLPDPLGQAVVLAARLHDSGKQRARFQTTLGNHQYPHVLLAKSGRGGARLPESFRHEFASLLDAPRDAGFQALSPDMQDLVLH